MTTSLKIGFSAYHKGAQSKCPALFSSPPDFFTVTSPWFINKPVMLPVNYWEGIDGWNSDLVQRNPRLALYIIQQDAGGKTQYKLNKREMDHIFPRSKLREKGFDDSKINNFANFWIMSKGKNINKTNKHPKKYFEDVPDKELNIALIDRSLLDYRRYGTFLDNRGKKILEKLAKKIGFDEDDFNILNEE